MSGVAPLPSMAAFGGTTARDLVEITDDPGALTTGRWAVCVSFEGDARFARFADWSAELPRSGEIGQWHSPGPWSSSMSRADYLTGVDRVRDGIAAGDVYQVNLCRVLSAPVAPGGADPGALWRHLTVGNPAPYAGFLRLPGRHVVSASPELFLRRDGDELSTGPIKGTATTPAGLTDKDRAENVMIVDLMRNDLSRVCRPGTVHVPRLLEVQQHPGLVHLVSYVAGSLEPGTTWGEILAALMPPGSVSGAPKLAALEVIRSEEPVPRGPYCGAFGWIDGDTGTAELAVAIRSFWLENGHVRFGTGAGITWGSDPAAEWDETQLKAARLVGLASTGSEPAS